MAENQFQDPDVISKDIDTLTMEVEKLRRAYDQYFLGLTKNPPDKHREKVLHLLRKLVGLVIRNAALKFRLQQTVAKFNTYVPYWDQTLRQMEEGSYKRDLFRVSLKEREKQEKPKESLASPSPKTPLPTNDPVAKLFDQYVQTRKKCNESVAGLTLEAFRKTIQTQIEAIHKKAQGASIRFQIVMEEGKTKIRALAQPKKPTS
jgi:hypothetical protein